MRRTGTIVLGAAMLALLALAPSAQARAPIKLDTGHINFGRVDFNGSLASQVDVIVTNISDHNVTLHCSTGGLTNEISLDATPGFCSQFLGTVVGPGSFAIARLAYDPSEVGRDTGTLNVTDVTDGYSKTAGMAGTGVSP